MQEQPHSFGIPDLIESLRNDLIESERRLALKREALNNRPDVQAFRHRREEISHATFSDEDLPIPEDLPRPLEMSLLDAPLSLESATIEIDYTVEVSRSGELSLQVLTGERAKSGSRSHRISVTLRSENEIYIGG